jgi:hypothetical protein
MNRGELMGSTVIEIAALYRALQDASGQSRVAAFKAFAEAVIAAYRRGELGILAAASFIEGALLDPELQAHESTARILAQVAALQSSVRAVSRDPAADWRALVKSIERLTP